MPNETICRYGDIDVLIHEATKARDSTNGHTSLEELFGFYPFECIKRIYAVHLTDGEPYTEVLWEYDTKVNAKVTLAYDRMKISV
jgi:ribonuclease Z